MKSLQASDLRHASQQEVVLEVGTEGGSVTLYRTKKAHIWQFGVITNEAATLDALSEDDRIGLNPAVEIQTVDSIDAALVCLDRYPWQKMIPLQIHPDYRDEILRAVRVRLSASSASTSGKCLPRWLRFSMP